MAIAISEDSLISKAVRTAVGVRKINPLQASTKEQDQKGNFLGWIWQGAKKLVGFLVKSIFGAIRFTLTALWSAIHTSVDFIMNFNWNISDEALDQQVKGRWDALGGVLGGAVGNAIGWIACGVLPGAAVAAFNEGLGAYILKEVGEEALDEIASNLGAVVNFSYRAAAQSLFAWAFKNTRKWLKKPGNIFAQALFGEKYAEVMTAWGEKNGPSFTFADYRDERINEIPNVFWRNFVSNAIEEAWDACIEAGYVVAMSAESYIAAQKLNQRKLLGPERVVEITPNRESEHERIILAGPEELIKPQIVQTLAQHQLIENRDIGQIVGSSIDEPMKAKLQAQRIVIKLFSRRSPPWYVKGEKLQEVTIKVPDVPRSRMDWEKIKMAVGGPGGYTWGNWRATAELDNARQLVAYAATKNEAEKRVRALEALTEAKILTINCTEELDVGVRNENPELKKRATEVYPGYVTIFVNRPNTQAGRVGKDGKRRKQASIRFNLWAATKPDNWDEEIAELFKGDTTL